MRACHLRGHGGRRRTAFYVFLPPQRFDTAKTQSRRRDSDGQPRNGLERDPQTGPNTPSVRSTPRQVLLILDDEDALIAPSFRTRHAWAAASGTSSPCLPSTPP